MGKRIGIISIVALVATVTSGFAFFQQVGSGMLGFWRLEETSSPSLDSSGNNHTSAAWPAGVTSLPGPANTPPALGTNSAACLDFDGSATSQISFPSTTALDLTGNFTVAVWVYKASEITDWRRIIGKGAEPIRTFGVWEEAGNNGTILFQQRDPGGAYFVNLTSTGTIALNTWTHVACRVNGSDRRIFINGVSSGSSTVAGAAANDAEPVTLGGAAFHSNWDGRLDDVRLYDRALSDAEISALATGSQGPPAPSNLTAIAGNNTVALAWTASGATVFNVKRGTAPGVYTQIWSNISGTNYTDNTAVNGTTYYYAVSGVSYGEGPNSAEVSATPLPVTATPNTGLTTSEALASTQFTIKYNAPVPAGGSIVTVVSNNPGEGVVSTNWPGGSTPTLAGDGFTITLTQADGSPTITVFVTGVDDQVVDPATAYTVTVTATNMGPYTIPNVQLVNNDNDTPNITFNRVSGLVTSENLTSDTFSVTLTTQPYGNIDLPIASLTPAEVTVSPATLQFTPANWNVAHVVTVTGVDDAVLDFTVPFTIQTGTLAVNDSRDNGYTALPTPDVTGINLDNEVIPTLPPVWGGGGSGGCGLLGPELLIPFALLALWRRRRDEN